MTQTFSCIIIIIHLLLHQANFREQVVELHTKKQKSVSSTVKSNISALNNLYNYKYFTVPRFSKINLGSFQQTIIQVICDAQHRLLSVQFLFNSSAFLQNNNNNSNNNNNTNSQDIVYSAAIMAKPLE